MVKFHLKQMSLVSALVSGLIFSGFALADGHGDHHSWHGKAYKSYYHGCGMMGKGMFRGLDLADEQKEQIKTILHDAWEAKHEGMKQEGQEYQSHKQAMQEIITAETFDEQKAADVVSKKTALHQAMMVNKMRIQHNIYQVLNSEQQEKFKQRMSQCSSHGKRT